MWTAFLCRLPTSDYRPPIIFMLLCLIVSSVVSIALGTPEQAKEDDFIPPHNMPTS